MTWDQFCATYKPGEYGRDATPASIQRDADSLQRLLACALYRCVEQRRAA